MKMKVLGSSSNGNCYILETTNEALVIEAGYPLVQVKKAIDWNVDKIACAVVSHSHGDHAMYVGQMLKAGIKVLAPMDVFTSRGLSSTLAVAVAPRKGYKVGRFKILTLDVAHDVPCMAYVISHPDMGKLFFITDTMMCGYKVAGINHWLVEANYADDILDSNIMGGHVPVGMRHRLLESHMELETTKGIFSANDMSQAQTIVLVHLSDRNSDEKRFKREVEQLTGIPTHIAKSGLEIELNNEPY